MSRLAVSPELLVQQLFHSQTPEVRIQGATFDKARNVVLLEIEGPGVPSAEEVIAVCHRQPPLRVEFQAR